MPTLRDLARRGLERLEESVGLTIVDTGYLKVQEAAAVEAFRVANDLEEMGYVAYDSMGGRPNEPTATTRRRWVQKARTVWHTDPQAGAAVELLNEFTFGRGVPKPRAKEDRVQKVIDQFWDDPQNQRVLTSFIAQLRLGNSLSVQSNIYWLVFDEGDDGKVQLSYLAHDTVENAISDPANRQRILYFTARKIRQEWDYKADRPKVPADGLDANQKLWYFEQWGAIDEALDERGLKGKNRRSKLQLQEVADDGVNVREREGMVLVEAKDDGDDGPLVLCPANKVGDGKVYHLYENTDMEGVFGIPRMRRTIRWYTAYNEFMGARTDMMIAAAKFIMQRTVKGSPRTLETMATRAMRATSDLQERISSPDADPRTLGPRGGGNIIQQNEGVQHEPMRLDSGSGNAVQDGQMLRAQVSAGDRFPQHYLGDVGSANLATATSMELPVLKHVEARQELVEGLFRFCIDRAIQRAVDTGNLDTSAPPEEEPAGTGEEGTGTQVLNQLPMQWRINGQEQIRETRVVAYPDGGIGYELCEAHEGVAADEKDTGLDLGYDFGLPSPLKRLMGDVVTACVSTAQAFDPNNTNTELSRTLLTYLFSEAFEIQDPEAAVDAIFPEGYVDPMMAMQQQQMAAGGMPGAPGAPPGGGPPPNFFSPEATGLPTDPTNPYGAPKKATPPEKVQESAVGQEGLLRKITVGRKGQPILWPGSTPSTGDVPVQVENARDGRIADLDKQFDAEMRAETMDALQGIHLNGHNGKGTQ